MLPAPPDGTATAWRKIVVAMSEGVAGVVTVEGIGSHGTSSQGSVPSMKNGP